MTATTEAKRANKYPAKCIDCRNPVGAQEGWLAKDAAGKWAAQHLPGTCPPPAAAKSDLSTVEPGVYVHPDLGVLKVQKAKHSDRVYAKRCVEIKGERLVDATEEHVHFEWDYEPGLVYRVPEARRMTLDEAKEFILRYGQCVRCGRKLKAAKSVEQGIGPVCIRYFGGEPWAG